MKLNKSEKFILDDHQKNLIQNCQKIIDQFFKYKSSFKNLFNFFTKKKQLGIYIFGSVGTGKTMIVKKLYDNFDGKKNFYHYQEFSKFIHEKMHIFYKTHPENPVKKLAQIISNDCMFLCVDEVEIRDIADAMIIKNLIQELNKLQVFIIFTSNIEPENLYKDGIQRDSFIPFIKYLKNNFAIFSLNSGVDYRLLQIENSKIFIFEEDNFENKNQFNELVEIITAKMTFSSKTLNIFGRKLLFEKTFEKILYINSDDLFKKELSYNDFITICKEFEIIIIPKILKFEQDATDQVIRFINFIDNLYATKTILVTILECKIEDLYNGKKNAAEFKRAISRLKEMNSKEFISNSKLISYEK